MTANIWGVNFDPSFCMADDGLHPSIYEYKDKIFHVHFKDIKLYPEKG